MGNADETPVFFDMPANTTLDTKGSKSVLVKTTGHEKLKITVMLSVLADGRKLTPFVILRRKNLPKEKLPAGIIFNEKGWMTEKLMVEWLKEVCHRRPGALPKRRGMLVLCAFKGHLTEKVKTVASNLLNTDLVITPGVALCGLVVSVLATGPKVHGFKPGRGRWISRVIKSFAGEIKPSVPCRRFTACKRTLRT
jgi:hypothetical protein